MSTIELLDEDKENKRIEINTVRCIGCGVCAFSCKSEAITMVKKFTKFPAKTMRDAMVRDIKGRIK
ncbi:MAG: 4Fe-4S binding protein [Candidatus Thorarchaeota archaeon]